MIEEGEKVKVTINNVPFEIKFVDSSAKKNES